ncbi:hypothetical protein ACI2IY_08185 [Lysobacter enzymogenes]|uniref:hypothetical protein n=1 Tax=Lysobacter enzymogenes TaxID=69 RepID=UPI00384CDE40
MNRVEIVWQVNRNLHAKAVSPPGMMNCSLPCDDLPQPARIARTKVNEGRNAAAHHEHPRIKESATKSRPRGGYRLPVAALAFGGDAVGRSAEEATGFAPGR